MPALNLLDLNITPIRLDVNVTPGKWDFHRGTVEMQMSRQKGGLTMHNTPAKLNIDTFECMNSIVPTAPEVQRQSAQKGKQAAMDATAAYAQQGKRAMEAPIGEEVITQFVKEAQFKNVKINVGIQFLPSVPPKISYVPGDLSIHYEADRLRFDWQVTPASTNYAPAKAEISVGQKPNVDVIYKGQPLLFPADNSKGFNRKA